MVHCLNTYLNDCKKVQNATAGFVTGKFAKVNHVITLGWLPIKQRIEFSLGKLAYNALKDGKWPGYLSLQIKKATRVFRSNTNGALRLALKVFNTLPENLKSLDFKNYKNSLKNILLERGKERTK